MEDNTDKKPVNSKAWNPNRAYLRKRTLKAVIRENPYIEREVIEKHWHEANPKK